MEKQVVTRLKDGNMQIAVDELKSMKIPGTEKGMLHIGFIRATGLPKELSTFMAVNPRVPNSSQPRGKSGDLMTLLQNSMFSAPDEFVLKNGGIYILADQCTPINGLININLTSRSKHGVVNGGHTLLSIIDAANNATVEQFKILHKVYVKIHIFTGIDEAYIPDMAEALNYSKPVDKPSLMNLKKEFAYIKSIIKPYPWSHKIAYYQGDIGELYITRVVAILEAFNVRRFDENKHPHNIYAKQSLALDYFIADSLDDKQYFEKLIDMLPSFLAAYDIIKKEGAEVASKLGYEFTKCAKRTTYLPFISDSTDLQLPNGWIYPMLSGLRACLNENLSGPSVQVVAYEVIPDLIRICMDEYDKGIRPEHIGKRRDIYVKCYKTVLEHLKSRSETTLDN